MEKPLIIAYYLPQFHPFKENDEWWGEGFTEWTNVKKAKPLFKGHLQPRIPGELGYYDLRDPNIRLKQAELALTAGVGGFCYWHYWFNGHQLMNRIIDEVANSGTPDFPFCLGWANESWSQKFWNRDSKSDRLLIEQTYGGIKDCRAHYEYVRGLFKNKNYIRIDGKPFFLIYRPEKLESNLYIDLWNTWIREDGIAEGVYFVANLEDTSNYEQMLNKGYNAIAPGAARRALYKFHHRRWSIMFLDSIRRKLFNLPALISMEDVNEFIFDKKMDIQENVLPVLFPRWDHTPRSAGKVFIIKDADPSSFQKQVEETLCQIKSKKNKVVMLKSWNEWAEGNYMEPDTIYGRGFLDALSNGLHNVYGK